MSRLEETYRGFARALTEAAPATVPPAILTSATGVSRGFRLYRNHYLITLEDALAATFPAVRSLVGPRYFGQAARRFIRLCPPESPCLFEYGDAFPDYLDELPEAAALPYLGDVARLEWAVNVAFHALDAPGSATALRAAARLGAGDERTVSFHPAVGLVGSPYPIAAIWRAAQPDSDPDLRVALDQGPESVLVLRCGDEAVFRRVSLPEGLFLRALAEGLTIARAAIEAGQPAHTFERLIHDLIEAGAIVGLAGPSHITRE